MTPEEQLERIHEWAAWVVYRADDGHNAIAMAGRDEYLARYAEARCLVVGADEENLTPAIYFRFKGLWLDPTRCKDAEIQQDVEWDALPSGKERKAAMDAYWAKWDAYWAKDDPEGREKEWDW